MFNPKLVTPSPTTRAEPHLSYIRAGGGWAMAGRSGLRDRRACNRYVTCNVSLRMDGKDAAEIALLRAAPGPRLPPGGTVKTTLRPLA